MTTKRKLRAKLRRANRKLRKAEWRLSHMPALVLQSGAELHYSSLSVPQHSPWATMPHSLADVKANEMIPWRVPVRRFADAMEAQLKANDHKGGWESESVDELGRKAQKALQNLRIAANAIERNTGRATTPGDRKRVLKEAADTANFAMMIADVCAALESP